MSLALLTGLRQWLIQSPPGEWLLLRIRNLLVGALSQGPVPQHVAFIMDGNRRYARKHHLETSAGHHLGSEALARILEVCYRSGVKVVTVYAFSLENFKRPKAEVDSLMDLALMGFSQLSQHSGLLEQYNAKFCFSGERNLLRPDVVEAIEKAIEMTKDNTGATLNICGAYTSRREMTNAMQQTVQDYATPLRSRSKRPFSETRIARTIRAAQGQNDVDRGSLSSGRTGAHESIMEEDEDDQSTLSQVSSDDQLASSRTSAMSASSTGLKAFLEPNIYADPESITAEVLNSHTYTADMPPIDLLVRTSCVNRLSDFMLWQSHQNTPIVFVDCLWPEFDLWHFLPILLDWQAKRKSGGGDGKYAGRQPAMATSTINE